MTRILQRGPMTPTRKGTSRKRSMVGMSCSRAARATGSGTARRYARPCASTFRQIVSGSDIINDGSRTVRVPVRMLEHYRFRLLATGESSGRRPGQGQARRCARPGEPARRAGAKRRRREGARRHRAHARVQGGRCHRLAVGGPEAAQSATASRTVARNRSGSARVGIGAAHVLDWTAAARSRSR